MVDFFERAFGALCEDFCVDPLDGVFWDYVTEDYLVL